MKTVMLEIEDSNFEQFMTMISLLKDDVIKKFEVQKKEDKLAINDDPMAQELQRRIQEIDDGTAKLIPHSGVMSRIYTKWERKCI